MPNIKELNSGKFASYLQAAGASAEHQIQLGNVNSILITKNISSSNYQRQDTFIRSSNSVATLGEQTYSVSASNSQTTGNSSKITEKSNNESGKSDKTDSSKEKTQAANQLTPQQQKAVDELKKIDKEVRSHESAHRSAGGGLVRGGTTFSFTIGPDGKQYAVGGEVKIDMSYDLNEPEEAIRKMQQVERAAMAPADPSSQDRAVASKAAAIESEARAEMQKKRVDALSKMTKGSNYLSKIYSQSQNFIENKIGETLNVLNTLNDNQINNSSKIL